MSRIKGVGLALVGVFMLGAVAAATASATNNWEEKVGGTWKPITEAKSGTSKGTLKLKDKKTALGESEIECNGTGKGNIGPNSKGPLTEVRVTKCTPKKICTSEVTAEAINIAPKLLGGEWQTELEEPVGGEIRDKITTMSGTKEVGWIFQCTAGSFGKQKDECKAPSNSTKMINEANGTVKAEFDAKSPKSNCEKGGVGSGEELGTNTFEAKNGTGEKVEIRVK